MIRFNGKRLVRLVGLLSKLDTLDIVRRAAQKPDAVLDARMKESVLGIIRDWVDAIDLPGFTLSKIQAERLRAEVESDRATHSYLACATTELRFRIEDELSLAMVWQVPPMVAALFEPDLFGEPVREAFQSLRLDIEESGKCLAMGRTTACVFHLMRVMEGGLRALAVTLNDPSLDPKRNPSWDAILSKCRTELGKQLKDRAPEWKTDDVFFSGAAASLMAVKDAWRNPTMHVEINYDEERASDVWHCVRAFMRHLATKLHE